MKFFSLLFMIVANSLIEVSCSNTAVRSKEVTEYINEFSAVIKTNAFYSDSINWEQLNKKVLAISKNLSSIKTCRPVIDTMLKTLRLAGDKHSFYLPQQIVQKIKKNFQNKRAESRYLGDGIGYIRVPEFASFDSSEISAFASAIQNKIKAIDTSYIIRAWMVDLRQNTGGNMYPMIAGLNCLTDDGIYGYFIDPKTLTESQLISANGQASMAKVNLPYKIKNITCKIAVLVDSTTASSGEITAISLKSLGNARFFGQSTAGLTTVNDFFELSDGSYLVLATKYMVDRNHQKYLAGIVPDVITPKQTDKTQDQTIEIAKIWLQTK
jgi:hypothetical protein